MPELYTDPRTEVVSAATLYLNWLWKSINAGPALDSDPTKEAGLLRRLRAAVLAAEDWQEISVQFEARVEYQPVGGSKILLPYPASEELRYHNVWVTLRDLGV